MPLYRCRFLDRTHNEVQTRVASENVAEAVKMARNMSTNSGGHGFELWQDERCVHVEKEPGPRC
jgi:hypothetical protein